MKTHLGSLLAFAAVVVMSSSFGVAQQQQQQQQQQQSQSKSARSSARASSSSSSSSSAIDGAAAGNGIGLRNLLQNPGVLNGGLAGLPVGNQAHSRSISVSENGKTVSITENNETGITVTLTENVGGKDVQSVVRAANVNELKKKSPAAFELYQRYAQQNNVGPAVNNLLGEGAAVEAGADDANSRSISVSKNGKTVTITENNETGITVTLTENIGGKEVQSVVRAANAEELKRKNPVAFRLYQQYASAKDVGGGGVGGGVGGVGGVDAKAGLREELLKMAEENAGNPQMQVLIQRMLRDLEK